MGIPTAPTAPVGTNTGQLATTAFVTQALSGFTGGSGNSSNVTLASLGGYPLTNPAEYQTAAQVATALTAPGIMTIYTSAGAIAPTDNLSIVNAASSVAMTLGNGVAGHQIIVKRYGTGAVTVTALIDGKSQTITMNSAAVQESITLLWSAQLASYVLI